MRRGDNTDNSMCLFVLMTFYYFMLTKTSAEDSDCTINLYMYLIETSFNTFVNGIDPDQADLTRAA